MGGWVFFVKLNIVLERCLTLILGRRWFETCPDLLVAGDRGTIYKASSSNNIKYS